MSNGFNARTSARKDSDAIGKRGLTNADRLKMLHAIVASRTVVESQRRQWFDHIARQTLRGSRVMKGVNFSATTATDLERMAELYDQLFFGGNCLSVARSYGMRFRWSKRMTSTGGKTVRMIQSFRDRRQSVRYEIVLSATLLFQTFGDLDRPVKVTGLICRNRLEAMQRILEHELIHLVEMLVWNESCCAAARFQSIAWRFFGHTEHKHDLITQQERARAKFNLHVGSLVQFQMAGKLYQGVVNRITRRATVLVRDPQGIQYEDGNRYRKFYVPLIMLRPARGKP